MDAKNAEKLLIDLKWVKTPGMGIIYAPIGRAKLTKLLNAFGITAFPRPGYEMLLHNQQGVKFYATNKSNARFEVNIYGDISRVIPEISQKAKVRAFVPRKSQWAV